MVSLTGFMFDTNVTQTFQLQNMNHQTPEPSACHGRDLSGDHNFRYMWLNDIIPETWIIYWLSIVGARGLLSVLIPDHGKDYYELLQYVRGHFISALNIHDVVDEYGDLHSVYDKKEHCLYIWLTQWHCDDLFIIIVHMYGKKITSRQHSTLCMISVEVLYRLWNHDGNIFRVTGSLCGEFTGLRWIPNTKASDAELWCFLWSAPN